MNIWCYTCGMRATWACKSSHPVGRFGALLRTGDVVEIKSVRRRAILKKPCNDDGSWRIEWMTNHEELFLLWNEDDMRLIRRP